MHPQTEGKKNHAKVALLVGRVIVGVGGIFEKIEEGQHQKLYLFLIQSVVVDF